MAQESFYGGRQGASFVIVKRFDAVNLPTNITVYKKREYAISRESGEELYIYENNSFVEKNDDNKDLYGQKLTTLNGDTVNIVGGGTATLPVETAKGMVQCFNQGGATTNIVNYGEYVIIDAPSSVDNGRVYRRGMNQSVEWTGDVENPGGGAEYIGQIVGPQGSIKDIEIGNYKDSLPTKGEWTSAELVSGADATGIKYCQENVRDDNGNIEKYFIGFQFPYLVEDQVSAVIDPYNLPENLVEDITGELAETHPFYKKYELSVPKGIKGDSITQASLMPTKLKNGTKVYGAVDSTGTPVESSYERTLDAETPITVVDYEITINAQHPYIKWLENDVPKYTQFFNGTDWHISVLLTNYDESSTGTSEWDDGGPFNTINNLVINNDGNLIAEQSGDIFVDLGHVVGKPGTSPIMTEVDDLNILGTLQADGTILARVSPEELGGDPGYKGQVVTYDDGGESQQIQAYDYLSNPKIWHFVGRFGGGGGNSFIISETQPTQQGEGDIWGFAQQITWCGPILQDE